MRDGAIYDVLIYSSDRELTEAVAGTAGEEYLFRPVDSARQLEIALGNFAPDLILLHLPTDADVDAVLKTDRSHPFPHSIVMGYPRIVQRQPTMQRLIDRGLNRFIPLPIEPAELMARLENYFAAHPKPLDSVKFKRLFAAGEPVFLENELGRECYVIVSGRVRICRVIDSRTMQEVGVLGPGECFGEMALLMSRPRSGTAIAVDDVVVTVSTRENFLRVVETDHEFGENLVRTLAGRSRRMQRVLGIDPTRAPGRVAEPGGEELAGGRRHFRSGDLVYEQGDISACFYLVEHGMLRETNPKGQSPIIAVRSVGAGSITGHVSHVLGRSHDHTALAAEETTCRVLSMENFGEVARLVPGLYLAMAQGLAVELDQQLHRLAGQHMQEVF